MSAMRLEEESGKKAKPPFCDKKPRTRESNRREEDSDSSLASIRAALNTCTQMHSELLAIVRSSGNSVSCYRCGGDHFVRSCPDLRLENGSYAKFCNYCLQAGHSVGRPSNPTCPTLICTVCPTCNVKGHTLDCCPQSICSSCNAQGHTYRVCKQRKRFPKRDVTFLEDSAPMTGQSIGNVAQPHNHTHLHLPNSVSVANTGIYQHPLETPSAVTPVTAPFRVNNQTLPYQANDHIANTVISLLEQSTDSPSTRSKKRRRKQHKSYKRPKTNTVMSLVQSTEVPLKTP